MNQAFLLISQALILTFTSVVFAADKAVREESLPMYKAYEEIYNSLSEEKKNELLNMSNWYYPEPLFIQQSDLEEINLGIKQRVRAMKAFLQDLVADQKIKKSGLVPAEVIDRVYKETGMNGRLHLVDPDRFAMFYGPDFLKDVNGQYYILEDNCTMACGLYAIGEVPRRVVRDFPELEALVAKPKATEFYERVMSHMKQLAKGQEIVLVRYHMPAWLIKIIPLLGDYDREWNRIAERLEPVGIKVVKVMPFIGREGVGAKVRANENGVFYSKSGHFEVDQKPVGYILNAVLNQHIGGFVLPGVDLAYANKKVMLSTSPGAEFFDNKSTYRYMDHMIRFYLNEEPILKSLKTRSFAKANNPNELDQEFLNEVLKNIDRWVIKNTSSKSFKGFGVLVGAKEGNNQEVVDKFVSKIKSNPSFFDAQQYVEGIIYKDKIFDMRPFTLVDQLETYSTKFPLSWGTNSNGVGKTKTSDDPHGVRAFAVFQAPSDQQISPPSRRVRCESVYLN